MKSCFSSIVFCFCFCCFLGDFTGVVLIGSEQAKVNPHNVSRSSGRTKNGNKGVPSQDNVTNNKGLQFQGIDASNDNGFRSQPDDLTNNAGVHSQQSRAENNRLQSQRRDTKRDGFRRSQQARGNRNIRETFRPQRPQSNGFQSPRSSMNNAVLPSAFASRIEQQSRSINYGVQSQQRGTKNSYNSQQSGVNTNGYRAQRPNGNSNGYGAQRPNGNTNGYQTQRPNGNTNGYQAQRSNGNSNGYQTQRPNGNSNGYGAQRPNGNSNGYRAQRSNTNNNRFQSHRPSARKNAHQSQRSTGYTNQAQSQRRNSNTDRLQAQGHTSNNQGFQAQRQNGNRNGVQGQRHGGNSGRFQDQRQNINNNGFQAQLRNDNKNNGYPLQANSNGYRSQQPQRNNNRFQSQQPQRNSGFQSQQPQRNNNRFQSQQPQRNNNRFQSQQPHRNSGFQSQQSLGNNNRYQSQRSNANNNNGHQSLQQPNANFNAFPPGQSNQNNDGFQSRQPGSSNSGFQVQQSRGNSNRFQAHRPVQRQLVGRNNNRYRENRMRTRQTYTYHDGFGTNPLAYKTSSFGSSRNNGFRTKQHDSGNQGFSPSGFAPDGRSMRPGTYSPFSSNVQANQFNNVNSKGFRRKQGPGKGLFSSVTDEPPILDYFSYHDPRIDWDALFAMEESNSAVLLRLIHLIGFASVNAGTAVSLYQEWEEGDGTYFDSKGEGSCQISTTDPLPPAAQNADFLAALNVEQYLSSAACGMCFRVQGEGKGRGLTPINGDYIVYVQDLCPSCKAGDMDLKKENGDGRWDIRIKAVQCPVGNTAIQYWFQGSNAWYIKLQVRNTRVPCKEVRVQTRTGQWKELNLTRDGHWAGSARLNLGGDVAVRLTSISGAVLDDIIPRLGLIELASATESTSFAYYATGLPGTDRSPKGHWRGPGDWTQEI